MSSVAQWRWPARFPLVQFPNPPLLIALAAAAGSRLSDGSTRRLLGAVHHGALTVWAYEEVRHGANWFRRSLGAGVGAQLLVRRARR